MIPAIGPRLTAFAAAALLGLGTTAPAQAEPGPAGCTGPTSDHWVNIAIEGLRNSRGVVKLTLYPDDASRFLKPKGSLYVTKVTARQGLAYACIYIPQPGGYGLALYHDENDNGKIDRNGLGIPKEGFGFSNNPRIFLSAPSFAKVRFTVHGSSGSSTRIKMKYP